jgi:hypothetical protein
MTADGNRSEKDSSRPGPTRAQRLVAAGFLGAFGLTMLTVLLTGLFVRAPRTRAGAEPPPSAAAVEPGAEGEAAPAAPAPREPEPESADAADASPGSANTGAASEEVGPPAADVR